jgi:quercetin dioxygenase-like cupin family protein
MRTVLVRPILVSQVKAAEDQAMTQEDRATADCPLRHSMKQIKRSSYARTSDQMTHQHLKISPNQRLHCWSAFADVRIGRRQFVQTVGATGLVLSAIGESFAQQQPKKAKEQEMRITRNGSQPSQEGSADWFTGRTRIDPLFTAPDPARAVGARVTFESGARTAWHTHPLGQTLIVTSGLGRVQVEGESIEEVRPGDVVWFPPGVKHWHGASPTTAMTHIAIQESHDGKVVEWMEHVTDEQYGA